MSIHVACLWMCVLFYFSLVCLHVCAYAFKFNFHCGSAFEPGASGLPYYCTPPVYVPAVIGALPVWRHNPKKKKIDRLHAHTTIHTNIRHELRECLRARRFRAIFFAAPLSVCVPAVIGAIVVWIQNQKKKKTSPSFHPIP